MKMVTLAKQGELDLILVKSISRFARNTVDVLSTVRELRTIGCIIYFEKENIYSDDPKIDFTLAILSSVAQEESRSISTNVKWSIEKRFKAGKMIVPRLFGYDKNDKGELIVNEEEAKIVKEMYSLFIQGYNINDIRKHLSNLGIKSKSGTPWSYSGVRSILQNEKFSGNTFLQKTVTTDYLTHKQVGNNNLATKYYVKNSHQGIISPAEFELTKAIFHHPIRSDHSFLTMYPLTGLL